ncbi:bifunctional UDP-N-acetylglucosamine diphosphorylase/glucosamine-1-phosphate N-acetyltransferase GlmU [Aquisalimonas lutea]|uniref:bifunctional UDP-N-acetylglucosamine diphosphorylase/glucosamine-1-phosphate N-acetyltransferase GlmU n=1 Tax=Aquisalimonas lutea TaxID=1327750 RepID=UPI0025B3ACB3|nr:bifunctional UDP-N-acetylglucosamine diphosphorylase/glucosamine-1-phosphate N-acetyltransferase GlmU [Aquisalimonas lutea]MDN3516599.1 bifunctional UDP-N-acetylglucosamine diphosphorylase/glucosamine-1-phosphate N-acetyltransferase GlmU [Aquisalimonas lutea]
MADASSRPLHVVILAAGQGTRMRSDLPKVLHPLAGRPLLRHVVDTALGLGPAAVHVVHGHGGDRVRSALADVPVTWVEQGEQLGTGHAVQQALPAIPDDASVLVLYGDVPLVRAETMTNLVAAAADGAAVLTTELADPGGYGRVIRDADGSVARIVEDKDATPDERAVRETNTGLMAAPAGRLRGWLARCGNDNVQGEYYLTDVVALARSDGEAVHAAVAADPEEVAGVNDRVQLQTAERAYQYRQAQELMRAGLGLVDAGRFDLRGSLAFGRDCSIDVGVVLEGRVVLGDGVSIGPYSVLRDTVVEDGATVDSHTIAEQAHIGAGAQVGPYARLRPGTELRAGARVGNFVETKKAVIGPGSKVNHLSYIGDAELGRDVNVGAGTITCNYDGSEKHRTVIEDGAFIGSDSQLVAPVRVGAGAFLGAGTTLTRDTEPESLTVTRAPQRSVPGWARRRRE